VQLARLERFLRLQPREVQRGHIDACDGMARLRCALRIGIGKRVTQVPTRRIRMAQDDQQPCHVGSRARASCICGGVNRALTRNMRRYADERNWCRRASRQAPARRGAPAVGTRQRQTAAATPAAQAAVRRRHGRDRTAPTGRRGVERLLRQNGNHRRAGQSHRHDFLLSFRTSSESPALSASGSPKDDVTAAPGLALPARSMCRDVEPALGTIR